MQAHGLPDWVRDETDVQIYEKLGPREMENNDRSWLTSEVRAKVHERLLSYEGWSRGAVTARLVAAGHEGTIKELVANMLVTGKSDDILWEYANEEAIPFLMPAIIHGSPDVPQNDGDMAYIGARRGAVHAFLMAIRYCDKFPPITLQWAEKMEYNLRYTDDNWIALITSWYEHNEAALLEKRYADATWVPRYKGKPTGISMEEARLREAHFGNQQRQRIAAAGTGSEPVAPKTSAAAWGVWAVLAFAAISAVVFFWMKRAAKTA